VNGAISAFHATFIMNIKEVLQDSNEVRYNRGSLGCQEAV